MKTDEFSVVLLGRSVGVPGGGVLVVVTEGLLVFPDGPDVDGGWEVDVGGG